MTERPRPARYTPVSESEDLLRIEPHLLHADTDVLAAIHQVAANPVTRIVGIVDDDGRLVGVLPVLRLAEAVVARVAPEALLSTLSDVEEIAAFSHTVEARTVGEAMLEPISIAPSATIDEAFRRMHSRHQSGIHVVDDDNRPIGYLDLLEVALVYADVLERVRRAEEEGRD